MGTRFFLRRAPPPPRDPGASTGASRVPRARAPRPEGRFGPLTGDRNPRGNRIQNMSQIRRTHQPRTAHGTRHATNSDTPMEGTHKIEHQRRRSRRLMVQRETSGSHIPTMGDPTRKRETADGASRRRASAPGNRE
eukprot:scaffold158828_cov32-Tisochrysis_lutea.AAC.8